MQSETFRGVLVSLMPGILRDTDRGFEAMNLALRDRAESRFADQLRCGEVDVVFQRGSAQAIVSCAPDVPIAVGGARDPVEEHHEVPAGRSRW